MSFDRLRHMEVFVRVYECGSFTAAARDLGMTQPAVTKSIKALEDHLGAPLINRSTRKLGLTDDGQLFYEDAIRMLEAMHEAENRIGKRAGTPSGLLRVTCGIAFGRLVMIPIIQDFLSQHPLIKLDLVLTDTPVDLIAQGIDVAVRIGDLADSSLRAKRIGTSKRITAAAKTYLQRSGTPHMPADLARHNCLVFTTLTTRNHWIFIGPNGEETVAVGGNFSCSNSEGIRTATLSGLGIAYNPEWLFTEGLADGTLIQVLTPYRSPPLPMHAVFPAGRYIGRKARSFVDFIEAKFAADPALRK